MFNTMSGMSYIFVLLILILIINYGFCITLHEIWLFNNYINQYVEKEKRKKGFIT